MGKWVRAGALLLAGVLALGAVPASAEASPSAAASATASAAASPAPRPVVVGNHLVDARTGATFVPRGANWPSFEYACWQGWGYSQNTAGEAALMATWKINTVRIPLNQDCWLGLQGSPAGNGRTKEGYRTAVESFVAQLNAAGIVAILDLHSSAPLGYSAHGQRAMPDAQSTAFWTSVATRFASNPSVMFDLFNEPYSRWNNATSGWVFDLTWTCWRDGGCQAPVEDDYTSALSGAKYTVVGMAELVAAVRAAGASQPIMLGGRDYSNDLGKWLQYRPDDDQLVASWHNYPGQVCHTLTCWNTQITAVAAAVPIVTGEIGQTDGGSDYLTTFMDWADDHGVGYLPWAWWRVNPSESVPNSRYALVGDDDLPKAPSGTALHDHLAALPTGTPSPPTVTRIPGGTRYAVAVAVSAEAFPTGSATVFVATGANYSDGLSAGPAAAAKGGPVLLNSGASLLPAVRAEIVRLKPRSIVVVGSAASVPESVVTELRGIQAQTTRIAGDDRYATSRRVAATALRGATVAYVASTTSYTDSITAGAAAGSVPGPLVFIGTTTASVTAAKSALRTLGVSRIVILGGVASVSAAAATSLATVAPVTRISAADRFSLSQATNAERFTTTARVFLVSDASLIDAIPAAAWAASVDAPLYLVPKNCVPGAVLTSIAALGATKVTLVGSTTSLSQDVFALKSC